MPGIDTLLTFSVAAFLLCISPGPSNLYIMARTISNGHSSGFAAASGMALGSMLYVFASALGLAAIFVYSPLAYTLLKLAGAAYLVYLGAQYFISAKKTDTVQPKKIRPLTAAKVFRQSIVVELTNPKTALFFLAFLPQFVDPSVGNVAPQFVLLGMIYTIIAFSSDMLVVFSSHQLGKLLTQHPTFSLWQERLSGGILVGLGGFIGYQELNL